MTMLQARKKTRYPGVQAVCVVVLLAICLSILFPFVLLIIASITDETELILTGYKIIPKAVSLDAYRYILSKYDTVVRSYGLTILVTVIGTTLSLTITSMLAYSISRKDMKGGRVIAFLVFFSMLFNGGLVPQYMLWTRILPIKNTLLALIVPNLMLNAMYVMLMRNYFASSIPPALVESAKIDGAGEFYSFRHIVLPLSVPIMAAIGLLVGLNYWNDWQNGMYYISAKYKHLYTYQLLLTRMMENVQYLATASDLPASMKLDLPSVSIRMAIAVLGVIPVLIIYPFFQKYFSKGLMIGAIKG